MNKTIKIFFFLTTFFTITNAEQSAPSFVTQKKKSSEKPSAVKEEIAGCAKECLTTTFNQLSLIAQKQHRIVQMMEDLMGGDDYFADATVKELQQCRDVLQNILCEEQQRLCELEKQCELLHRYVKKVKNK